MEIRLSLRQHNIQALQAADEDIGACVPILTPRDYTVHIPVSYLYPIMVSPLNLVPGALSSKSIAISVPGRWTGS